MSVVSTEPAPGNIPKRSSGVNQIVEAHPWTRRRRLEDRTAVQARSSVRELLDELAIERGMTWSSIARLCGVPSSAVRKWRHGEDPSPDSRLAVARLIAFIGILTELSVSEPATWLAMPMVSNYTITAEDLYAAGLADLLLDFASGQTELNEVLNSFDENWRTRYRSGYKVIKAGDNNPSIVQRI